MRRGDWNARGVTGLLPIAVAAAVAAGAGCSDSAGTEAGAPVTASAPASASASASAPVTGSASAPVTGSAPAPGEPAGDPMALHADTKEALDALLSFKPKKRDPIFLEKTFGVGTQARVNQGNKAIAEHLRDKATCLAGLRGITLQTEEQRARCGGEENMVPIYKGGKPERAKTCIDIFEFPNRPCELPMVWTAPTQAAAICAMQGKRLCGQEEWILACRGDPGGGDHSVYAYGERLDLEACNTSKTHRPIDGAACDPDSAASAWRTCATDTEPSGSFPRCRSRFGVFDQHGNVAEIMSRLDEDGKVYSQLKGSAFFYKEVAREHDDRNKARRENYPDHCAHDPRWHVEPIRKAWHVNYHLGFRCCKSL